MEHSKQITMSPKSPTVIMLVGLQGSGKTTHAGIGILFQNRENPLLVACDIYRPAAIKQLQVVGKAETPVFEYGKISSSYCKRS